jgi:uncharacterized protein (TIRG00374 family)
VTRVSAFRVQLRRVAPFLLGAAIFSCLLYYGSSRTLATLGNLDVVFVVAALAATVLIGLSVSFRWGLLANAMARRRVASRFEYYYYFIISRALGFLLPKDVADFGTRSLLLKRLHGYRLAKSGSSVVLDRLFDAVTTGILLLAVLPYWTGLAGAGNTIFLIILLTAIAGGVSWLAHAQVLAVLETVTRWGMRLARRIPRMKKHLQFQPDYSWLGRDQLLILYLLSLAKFAATAARLILFSLAMGLSISPTLILLGTPLGQLSYVFAFTPGGLGIFELGWVGILSFAGVGTEETLAFVVGQRVLTVLLVAFLALLSHLVYHVMRFNSLPIADASNSIPADDD